MRILAIDGGGIRGVVPSSALALWELELGLNAGQAFDLYAGTSTGSIVASALACGLSADRVLRLFQERASLIFSRETLSFTQRALSFKGWAVPAYSEEPLRQALTDAIGDITLGECPKPLLIPCLDVVTGATRVFRSAHHAESRSDHNVKIVDAVVASAAAPTFFPSASIAGSSYVDGSLWANNPALLALLDARDLQADGDIKLLSLGCGRPIWGKPVGFGTNRGFLGWGTPLMSLTMAAQSEGIHSYVRRLVSQDRYVRVDPTIPRDLIALDEPDNIPALLVRAAEAARENRDAVRKLLL
jgi:predicted acylesterase/phospholipase RssA